MESLGFTKLLGLSTKTMAILHENEFFVLQIAGDYFLLLNQRVCRRQTEQEFLAEELTDLNSGRRAARIGSRPPRRRPELSGSSGERSGPYSPSEPLV